MIRLKVPRKHPRVLTAAEMQAILDGCDRLRDRLLFAMLHDTGMWIGEALGAAPRGLGPDRSGAHGDGAGAPGQRQRARAKSAGPRTIPTSAQLVRLYAASGHQRKQEA